LFYFTKINHQAAPALLRLQWQSSQLLALAAAVPGALVHQALA
jgi:hypothetical protein